MDNEIEKMNDQQSIENEVMPAAEDEGEVVSQSADEQEQVKERERQQKKLNEAEQAVSKQKSKKSKALSVGFFIFNIVVVAGILIWQLAKENWNEGKGYDINLHWPSLICLILMLGMVLFFETFCLAYLLKQSTGKWRFGLAYKTGQIGRYYDNVTPMATGGQPFQVTYLKGHGVPIHNALSIPLAKYMFNQIGWLLISLIALIVSICDKSYGDFVRYTSFVGFVLAFLVLFIMFFLSISKKIGKVLVVKTLKFLHKIKIVKNYDKQYEKIMKSISDYQDVMKQYAKSPKDFIILTIASFCKCFANYSMPFFIVKFFVPTIEGELFFKLMIMSNLVDLSASFFPLPGGTGMNEISFSEAFRVVAGDQAPVVYVLIMWRMCTYYYFLVQGLFILTYDMAYGNRKYRWQVVKNNLVEESAVFKQQQINRFRADRAKRRKLKNAKV